MFGVIFYLCDSVFDLSHSFLLKYLLIFIYTLPGQKKSSPGFHYANSVVCDSCDKGDNFISLT